jgi:hypothetical protein
MALLFRPLVGGSAIVHDHRGVVRVEPLLARTEMASAAHSSSYVTAAASTPVDIVPVFIVYEPK